MATDESVANSQQMPDHWDVKVYDADGEERETVRGVNVARRDTLMKIFDREGVQAQAMAYDAEGKIMTDACESVNWDTGVSPESRMRRGTVDISFAVDDLAHEMGYGTDEYEVAESEYVGDGQLRLWYREVGEDGE